MGSWRWWNSYFRFLYWFENVSSGASIMIWSLHATFWGLRSIEESLNFMLGWRRTSERQAKLRKNQRILDWRWLMRGLSCRYIIMCSGKAVPISIFLALLISGATDQWLMFRKVDWEWLRNYRALPGWHKLGGILKAWLVPKCYPQSVYVEILATFGTKML